LNQSFAFAHVRLTVGASGRLPAIYVDRRSLFILFFAAVFSDPKAEFHNFVAGVCEAYSAGILSGSADDGQLMFMIGTSSAF
jgi:hypothetical protein